CASCEVGTLGGTLKAAPTWPDRYRTMTNDADIHFICEFFRFLKRCCREATSSKRVFVSVRRRQPSRRYVLYARPILKCLLNGRAQLEKTLLWNASAEIDRIRLRLSEDLPSPRKGHSTH